jgi:hypothetical protein
MPAGKSTSLGLTLLLRGGTPASKRAGVRSPAGQAERSGERRHHRRPQNWGAAYRGCDRTSLHRRGRPTADPAADEEVYTVALTVTDDDGGVGTQSQPVIVLDPAGVVTAVAGEIEARLAGPPLAADAVTALRAAQRALVGRTGGALEALQSGNRPTALRKLAAAIGQLAAAAAAESRLDLTALEGTLAWPPSRSPPTRSPRRRRPPTRLPSCPPGGGARPDGRGRGGGGRTGGRSAASTRRSHLPRKTRLHVPVPERLQGEPR